MPIGSACVWEVRTTGNDTNGGGYAGGGTDWSQQDAAQYSVTDGVTAGTTTITSATANFGTDVVGNVMYVQGGTGAVVAGWYQIISRTNATTIVVDRSTGLTAGTGVTLKIGGCFATPGRLPGLLVAGNLAWIKSGTYTLTTSTVGPSGPFNLTGFVAATIIGYESTRGDYSTNRPIMHAGAITSVSLWRTQGGGNLRNVSANGNSGASNVGFQMDSAAQPPIWMCTAVNCVTGFNNCNSISCVATSCTTQGYINGFAMDAQATSCVTGFRNMRVTGCIAKSCTSWGFLLDGNGDLISHCIADTCPTGFSQGYLSAYCCIAVNCTTGFSAVSYSLLRGCAGWNNTTNKSGVEVYAFPFITLASSPFVSSSDYTISSASAAGLIFSAWLGQSWNKYIGAVPPVAGGGSGGVFLPRPQNGGYSA